MAQQNLKIIERGDCLDFYIDGYLQFSSRDEHIYHEMLVHPAAGILEKRRPSSEWNALVLGGGDGLALREVLKYQRCRRVDLVDHDPTVLSHAGTTFSDLNCRALCDGRVSVLIEDASEYLSKCSRIYDLIIADFTFPDTIAGAGLFTREFHRRIGARLRDRGLFSLNSVSPTQHTIGYWSIYKTLTGSGMFTLPMHLSIPSFFAHGFDRWGFFLSSPDRIRAFEMTGWKPMVPTRFAKRARFLESLRFPASGVRSGLQLGNIIAEPSDLLCALHLPVSCWQDARVLVDFSRSNALKQLESMTKAGHIPVQFDHDWLVRVVKILRSIDLEKLFDEVAGKLERLSEFLREQFRRLRSELPALLKDHVLNLERAGQMICILMLLITFLNLVYPDSAYAKGFSSSSHGASGYHSSSTSSSESTPYFHMRPFVAGALLSAISMSGERYPKRKVPVENGGRSQEELFYAISSDLFLTPTGNAYMVSSAGPYQYRMAPDSMTMFREGSSTPIVEFLPDDGIRGFLVENATIQLRALDDALEGYKRWNVWTSPVRLVSDDLRKEEIASHNLEGIRSALMAVLNRFGAYQPSARPPVVCYRLAPGIYIHSGGILLATKKQGWVVYPWKYSTTVLDLPEVKPIAEIDDLINQCIAKQQANDPKALEILNQLRLQDFKGPSNPDINPGTPQT